MRLCTVSVSYHLALLDFRRYFDKRLHHPLDFVYTTLIYIHLYYTEKAAITIRKEK